MYMDGIAYAAIIFVCAAVGGGTPLVMRHRLRGPRIDRAVRLGTIFGGGVFLGSGFLHLLADAAGELNDVDGYPYAELYCCCGVLFPLCVDSVASIFASRAKRLTRTARRGAAGTDTDPDGVAFVGARRRWRGGGRGLVAWPSLTERFARAFSHVGLAQTRWSARWLSSTRRRSRRRWWSR